MNVYPFIEAEKRGRRNVTRVHEESGGRHSHLREYFPAFLAAFAEAGRSFAWFARSGGNRSGSSG